MTMNRRAFVGSFFALVVGSRHSYASGHNPNCYWRDRNGIFQREKRIIIQDNYLEHYRAYCREALATGEPQTVLVEKVAGFKLVLQDIRGGNLPPGSVAIFDRSRNPDIALGALDDPIKRTILYYNVPETLEEARNVHGNRDFDFVQQQGYSDEKLSNDLPDFVNVARQFESIGAIKIRASSNQSASKWLEQAVSSHGPDDLVVIISHIVQYGVNLKTPNDGSFLYPAALLPLVDGSVYIPNIPNRRAGKVWLIGCETWNLEYQIASISLPFLTFGAQIDYPVAYDIAKEALIGDTIKMKLHSLQKKRFRLPSPRERPIILDKSGHPLQLPGPPAASAVAQMYEGSVLVINAVV